MLRIVGALFAVTSGAQINEAFLGEWSLFNHTTAHSPMGPSGLFKTFGMSKDTSNGDYWMSAIKGQVFRIRDNLMQYCFSVATSTFVLQTVTPTKLLFCYETGKRMNSHRRTESGSLAIGCDAASITVELLNNGNLEFTFLMSPPVKHASAIFHRTGKKHTISSYKIGGACDPKHPGHPTLESAPAILGDRMCPVRAERSKSKALMAAARMEQEVEAGVGCRQMDGGSWMMFPSEKVDVRLQYAIPKGSCWPCKVSYTVSAGIREDQYVSVGFKGMAYRAERLEVRPGYFGMATDPIDAQRTSRAIVLGYPQGGCVREMEAKDYVGVPADVEGNPSLSGTSVERKNGRTIVRFTIEQHVGRTNSEINTFFNTDQFSARVMWAIGDVQTAPPAPPADSYICSACRHIYDAEADGAGVAFEDLPDTWVCPICLLPKSYYQKQVHKEVHQEVAACREDIQYHGAARGVSPLSWFDQNPKCVADSIEFGTIV